MLPDTTASARAAIRPAESIVSIDPGKVLDLSRGLAAAAEQAGGLAGRIAAPLAELGEDATIVGALHAFASWCLVERVAVRSGAEAILGFEAGAVPAALGGFVVHHAPDRPEFASPGPAVDAATAAVAASERGDVDELAGLLDRWSGDAVFAAVLLDQLGAAGIGEAVDLLAALTGSGLDDERRRQEQVVHGLAESLATARRTDGSTLDMDDLAAAMPTRPTGELALLFLGGTAFDADFLVEAFARLVDEPTGSEADAGMWVASAIVDGEGDVRDSTTLVLRALAANPTASAWMVLDADLQHVLVDTPYRDGGRALGAVLDVATDPVSGDPAAPAAAVRLIAWVADRVTLGPVDLEHGPDLAPGTHAALGLVAAHYIGSFRSDPLDDIVVEPVSDQLRDRITGDQADRFLVYAAREEEAADAMRAALIEWAAAGVARVAADSHPSITPFTAVGDVGRHVSDAVELGAVSWAASVDRRRDAEIALWSTAASATSSMVPGNTLVASAITSFVGSRLIDRFLPGTHAELDAAKGEAPALSADQLRLEQVALGVLWNERAANHLFDAVPPPPELLDGDRLRTLPEIDDDGALEAFTGWLAQLAAAGVPHLDRLAAEFGATGARPSG